MKITTSTKVTDYRPHLDLIRVGECFLYEGCLYIKTEPSPNSHLLNSHLIREVIMRGDSFVTRLKDGLIRVLTATTPVTPKPDAHIVYDL